MPLHVDVSWLCNVVPSFSLCSDHHTAHRHASRTVALCFSHANLCCIVLNSLCALGNAFSLALCHMLVAAQHQGLEPKLTCTFKSVKFGLGVKYVVMRAGVFCM